MSPCAIALIILSGGRDALAILSIFGISIIAVSVVSAFQIAHYSLRSRQAANTAIQFEFAALAIAFGILGPIAVLLTVVRIELLRRAVERKRLLLA